MDSSLCNLLAHVKHLVQNLESLVGDVDFGLCCCNGLGELSLEMYSDIFALDWLRWVEAVCNIDSHNQINKERFCNSYLRKGFNLERISGATFAPDLLCRHCVDESKKKKQEKSAHGLLESVDWV